MLRKVLSWFLAVSLASSQVYATQIDDSPSAESISACADTFSELTVSEKKNQSLAASTSIQPIFSRTQSVARTQGLETIHKVGISRSFPDSLSEQAIRVVETVLDYKLITFNGIAAENEHKDVIRFIKQWSNTKNMSHMPGSILRLSPKKKDKFFNSIQHMKITEGVAEEATEFLDLMVGMTNFHAPSIGHFAVVSATFSFIIMLTLSAVLNSYVDFSLLGLISTFVMTTAIGAVLPGELSGGRQARQLKNAVRADLDSYYGRNSNLTRRRKQLPLQKELVALPGSGQEYILQDYHTLSDISQLAHHFKEARAKASGTSKGSYEKLSELMDSVHTVQTRMNEAMAEYLVFSHAPADEKPCEENLKCQKFKTILWTIIDSDARADRRAEKVEQAKKLAAVLNSDLRAARSEAVALVTQYKESLKQIQAVIKQSESESMMLADRFLFTQTSLDDFESSIQRLSEYIANVQSFETELMKREGGKIPPSDNSLRINW